MNFEKRCNCENKKKKEKKQLFLIFFLLTQNLTYTGSRK